jgi:hypothetical protein
MKTMMVGAGSLAQAGPGGYQKRNEGKEEPIMAKWDKKYLSGIFS